MTAFSEVDKLERIKIWDGVVARAVVGAEATFAHIELDPNTAVPEHHHVNEQVSMVKSGALEFDMDGERFVLRAGDVLVIPPNMAHSVEALEETDVTDYFTPARQDWISGDDSYLRNPK